PRDDGAGASSTTRMDAARRPTQHRANGVIRKTGRRLLDRDPFTLADPPLRPSLVLLRHFHDVDRHGQLRAPLLVGVHADGGADQGAGLPGFLPGLLDRGFLRGPAGIDHALRDAPPGRVPLADQAHFDGLASAAHRETARLSRTPVWSLGSRPASLLVPQCD